MLEENKKVKLNDEELEKVSGGENMTGQPIYAKMNLCFLRLTVTQVTLWVMLIL